MAAGLAILTLMAWAWTVSGAGLGMSAAEMTSLSLFPHKAAETGHAMPSMSGMPGMDMPAGKPADLPAPEPWSNSRWGLTVGMWWVMMAAMMTPSAAPAILLYARVHRAAATRDPGATIGPAWVFTLGYLLVWLAFSVLATGLQWLLEHARLLSAGTMGSQSRWLSAGVLMSVGLYQLSPLQRVCLDHCRGPTAFFTRHWRPGLGGAVRLGVLHGAYCVGCCLLLMFLLFVGGVMNLAWIAAIALLVLAEKVMPAGPAVGRIAAAVLITWGVATLTV